MMNKIDANPLQRRVRRMRGLRKERTITRGNWDTGEWPFLVPRGKLVCDSGAVTFTTNYGVTYALNGNARARMTLEDWRNSDDIVIWDDERRPVPLTAMIGYGLNL